MIKRHGFGCPVLCSPEELGVYPSPFKPWGRWLRTLAQSHSTPMLMGLARLPPTQTLKSIGYRDMNEDPIVAEIRRYRFDHAKKYGNDLGRICEALREVEAKSHRKIVHRKPHLPFSKVSN